MPTSFSEQISQIIKLIILSNPKKLLDIGIGFGKYGFLAREYLDIWNKRYNPDDWERKIDGIEVFENYINPVHSYIYDEIFIGEALGILSDMEEKYDLILLIDVLEHFNFEKGAELLKACRRSSDNILISTPKSFWYQVNAHDNPFETHHSFWNKRDFSEFSNKFFLPHPKALIVYIGNNAQEILLNLKTERRVRILIQILEKLHLKKIVKKLLRR